MNVQAQVETKVSQRYAEGAGKRQEALCCPVDYDASLLELLPQEIIDRDYGCGDPSRYVKAGDTVLDLGSGDLPRELEQQELVVYGIEVCTLGGLPPDAAGTRAISLAAINRAWGMSERYHSEAVAKLYQNGSSARKERSDCGRSIFTDHEFARRRITAYSEWRRELTQDGGVGATAVDSSALREEFESTDAVTRQEYEYKAEQRRLRVPHARQEAIEVMKRTNGLLSWDALADELGGYCCGETCRVRTRSCCGS